jgi:hypothetical protein
VIDERIPVVERGATVSNIATASGRTAPAVVGPSRPSGASEGGEAEPWRLGVTNLGDGRGCGSGRVGSDLSDNRRLCIYSRDATGGNRVAVTGPANAAI